MLTVAYTNITLLSVITVLTVAVSVTFLSPVSLEMSSGSSVMRLSVRISQPMVGLSEPCDTQVTALLLKLSMKRLRSPPSTCSTECVTC